MIYFYNNVLNIKHSCLYANVNIADFSILLKAVCNSSHNRRVNMQFFIFSYLDFSACSVIALAHFCTDVWHLCKCISHLSYMMLDKVPVTQTGKPRFLTRHVTKAWELLQVMS